MSALRWTLGMCVVAVVGGCDARVDSDYEGESLLRIQGTVVLESAATQPLVPVLAFRSDAETLHLMDVRVQGEFPASFRFDVLDPPPAAALLNLPIVDRDAEPRMAIAYLAAVPADHPDALVPANNAGGSIDCSSGTYCMKETHSCVYVPDTSPVAPESPCPRGDSFVPTECYRRVLRCDYQLENCELQQASGNRATYDRRLEQFAGFSLNYAVLYLDSAAPRGSLSLRRFGIEGELAAGYHLLKVRFQGQAPHPRPELIACSEEANSRALASYNAKHGTRHVSVGELAANGDMCEANSTPERHEYFGHVYRAHLELNCLSNDFVLEPVDSKQPVSIVVGHSEFPDF